MLVFLDFEASSLAKRSYPIEVAWVFEDGRSESYLIRPAPDWTDWDPAAEAIHRIPRETLVADGTPHEEVAHRMIEQLTGHDLLASAPSWDGKWMSALLRASGLPRRSLRLRDTDEAQRETAIAILAPLLPPGELEGLVCELLAHSEAMGRDTPAHRALADAQVEHGRWLGVRRAAEKLAQQLRANG
ncbi:3'-5' exonuclease [Sphingomonas sp. OTU376]|uniref:3'-5' exonuclease n=1 Tax=Sphingomonas sp. OTU376 TaxID=3043863 RepID=UPI00313E3A4C